MKFRKWNLWTRSNPRGRTDCFLLTLKPCQKKIASKFKLELEITLPLGVGRLMTLAKVLLQQGSKKFFNKVIWLMDFFFFWSLNMDTLYIFQRDSWKPEQNYFLCTTLVLLPSAGCSDFISLGKRGLPWDGRLFQGGT